MRPPVVTEALAERLQRVLGVLQVAGITRAQQLPGNPFGVHIERFGSATAYLAAALPGEPGWWNRVVGLDAESAERLDDILAFFRERKLRCYADVSPLVFTHDLARLLAERGLYATYNGTVLYGTPPAEATPPAEGVEVREVGPEGLDTFAEMWALGFEVTPGEEGERVTRLRRCWFEVPGSRRFIAYVDGAPAAMAGLYIQDGVGYLNVGGTLPEFRRRGCHTALTHHRIYEAAKAGCDLVMGHTGAFGSLSQNNMERAGLRIAYSLVNWVDRA